MYGLNLKKTHLDKTTPNNREPKANKPDQYIKYDFTTQNHRDASGIDVSYILVCHCSVLVSMLAVQVTYRAVHFQSTYAAFGGASTRSTCAYVEHHSRHCRYKNLALPLPTRSER